VLDGPGEEHAKTACLASVSKIYAHDGEWASGGPLHIALAVLPDGQWQEGA
jgi:hypothetical protein